MAIKSKELRQKAGKIELELKRMVDEAKETFSKEEEAKFDQLYDESQELLKQATKIEAFEKREIETDSSEEVNTIETKKEFSKEETEKAESLAMRSYLSKGAVPAQLHQFMRPCKEEANDSDMISAELKKLGINMATQTTTTTGGGYTIPRGFMSELEKALLAYGGMWEAARIVRTAKGNTMDWPTTNDTANKAYLLSESTSAATSATAVTFGQQQFEAWKYTSGLVQIPTELIEDSEFNITAEIQSMLVERIWRGTNEAFTTADGSNKPKGVVNASTYGYSTAADGAISADDIVELFHSVDPAYRSMPGARFMMHDTLHKAIIKLSTANATQNFPIWLPSLRDGAPSTILNKPYTINQDMASFDGAGTASDDNKKIMLFGDFQKYIIRQVRDMRIVRLNERYGELDQVAFVVFFRVDGDLLDAGTHPIKHLRVSTT